MQWIKNLYGGWINPRNILQLRVQEMKDNSYYIYADLINDDMIVIEEHTNKNVAINHLEKIVKKLS